MESINPNLGVDEQAELLPYDKKWEFPIEKLKLGKYFRKICLRKIAYSNYCLRFKIDYIEWPMLTSNQNSTNFKYDATGNGF